MNFFYFSGVDLEQSDAASRHTLEICNNLAQRGHHILLFVPHNHPPVVKSLHSSIQLVPVPVRYGHIPLLISILFYLALPWTSWRYFRQIKPEIVYTRASFLDFIAIAPLQLFFKFSYVAEINGIRSMETSNNTAKRWVIAWFERLSMRLCDKAIGVTPELCQWAINQGRLQAKQVIAIGNGVPTELFYPIPAEQIKKLLNLDLNKRYLNFTSSLKAWHGTRLLIKALPVILAEFPDDVCLLIVGDGPERQSLTDLAHQIGVNEAIHWVGSVSIEEVPQYINASELCLAPFVLERNVKTGVSPIKVFEYMACGRPFVTTRIGAAYDMMIESCDCGILVPPDDVNALAESVIYLLHYPEQGKEMGELGRETAVNKYSWAKIAEQIEQFII